MSQNDYRKTLETTLDQIAHARAVWEDGSLKAANEELYAILERCFAVFVEMKEDTAKRRTLNALLTDRAMKPRSNTSLGLKVIRYVFGKEGNREQAYAKILGIAYDLKPADQSLTSYIEECGGVEEVRRTSKIKDGKTMTAEDYKQMAVMGLNMARIPVASFDLPEFIQPNSEYDEDYVVGLIRCNPDGTGDLLFGNNDAKVIDTVLIASGKYLDQKAQDDQKGLEAADVAKRRTEDVKTFAPKLFASMSHKVRITDSAITAAEQETSLRGVREYVPQRKLFFSRKDTPMTFAQRHRPRSVHDLVFADPTVAGIVDRYAHARPSKPLLLYGAPGTGKSEALRLIAETQFAQAGIECEDFTINGADAAKGIYDKMLNMAQMQMWPVGTPAIIVVDEIDEIEDALPGKTRTFMEQHPSVQILASTNYIKKLKPALQSRMRCVEVKKPAPTDWVPRAQAILTAEGASVTTTIVQQLMANFTGDARDFIDYLEEQVHAARQFVPAASAQPRTVSSILNQASGGTP